MEKNESQAIYDKVFEIAQKLQRHYFDNERFFDNINGASCMDNVTGWMYDFMCAVDGIITGAEAEKEINWTYDAFKSLAVLMERHGAGITGSARGINHNIQYTWAMSEHAASLIKDIAEKLNYNIAPLLTLNVNN